MAVIYIVCSFLCESLVSFIGLAVSAILLVLVSRIPFKIILGSLRPILFIIVFTSLINVFMTRGGVLLTPESW